jgi:uncharacterized protein YbaR (Trm112 family)
VDEFLLKILVCPENQQGLEPAHEGLIRSINGAIESGSLQDKSGETIEEHVDNLLVRKDGLIAYPVRNKIPEMLEQRGIDLSSFSKE